MGSDTPLLVPQHFLEQTHSLLKHLWAQLDMDLTHELLARKCMSLAETMQYQAHSKPMKSMISYYEHGLQKHLSLHEGREHIMVLYDESFMS